MLIGTLLTTTGVAAQQQTEPLTVDSPSVSESGGTLVFTVRNVLAIDLEEFPSGTVEVSYNTNNGSATSGSDYTYTSGTLEFTSVGQTAQVTVPILSDGLDEDDETYILLLNDPRAPSAHIFGTGTILDDDDRPKLTLGEDVVKTESGVNFIYPISLSEPSSRRIVVQYEVLPGLARNSVGDLIDPDDCGSATDRDACQPATPPPSQDADYRVSDLEVVIEPGETSPQVGIWISAVNDRVADVNDRDETFTVRVIRDADNPAFDFATPADETAQGLILDDDLPRISISEWGGGFEGPYGVNWGISMRPAVPPGGEPVTVEYRTVDNVFIPGEYSSQDEGDAFCSADANEDYVPVSGTLTFSPGETFKSVSTNRLDDEIAEPVAERICLELYDQSQNALLELEPVWYSIIYDDEEPSAVSVTSHDVNENVGSVTFKVALTRPGTDRVDLTYTTEDGTAEAPGDYTSTSGTLTYGPGDMTSRDVTVTIHDDTLDEVTEKFKLVVSGDGGPLAEGTVRITDNDGEPSLSVADAEGDEDDGRVDFTVRLSAASGQTVTVAYATAPDTDGAAPATEGADCTVTGADYDDTSGTLTFQPGQPLTQTVSVTVCDDALYEQNETFLLQLSGAQNAELPQATATATGEIENDDMASQLSVADARADEDAGPIEFTVSLERSSSDEVTVKYRTTDGSAIAPGDYTAYTEQGGHTLTFGPTETSMTVRVPIVADSLDEEQEQFNLILYAPSNAALRDDTAIGYIDDANDLPVLSVRGERVDEDDSDGNVMFTVTLGAESAKEVTVDYATADGTGQHPAIQLDDYAPRSGTLTFAPGDRTKTVSVPIVNDAVDEHDEEFSLTLTVSDSSNATLDPNAGSATGTIRNDDSPPVLSVDDASADEDDADGVVFTVTLSAASGKTVEVLYSASTETGDTATAGEDYTAVTDETLRFEPGDPLTKEISVPILNDVLDEADAETFTLTLHSQDNATLDPDHSTATGTINDNDAASELSVANAGATEGGTVTFTVTLNPAKDSQVDVAYSTSNVTATGGANCATDGVDYIAQASGMLQFAAQETTKTISVVTCDDSLDELDAETFGLQLTSSDATAPADAATGTINDGDDPAMLSVADATLVEGAGGNDMVFTVTLSPASGRAVTVRYRTADDTAPPDDPATAVTDYSPRSGTLGFSPGSTEETIVVPIVDDDLDEASETFRLLLSGANNATLADDEAIGTITDNDELPSLSIGDETVVEDVTGGQVMFTVMLSRASSQDITVDYATADDPAATQAATAGDDYTSTDGRLTISAGFHSAEIPVAIIKDTEEEQPETFLVKLSMPSANATISDDTAIGTITDTEPLADIEITNASADESAGQLTFSVTLKEPSTQPVTVRYETRAGTATEDVDYTATTGTLTFVPNDVAETITVPILHDTLHEPTEVFTVHLSAVGARAPTAPAEGEIRDDDPPPELSVADVTVSEGARNAEFTVTLSAVSGRPVEVEYATAADTATAGEDYSDVSSTLLIPAGDMSGTIIVPLIDDDSDEPDESFTLTLTNPDNASIADDGATATITDDDNEPGLSVADSSASEDVTELDPNDGVVFTVRVEPVSSHAVTVDYETADGSAEAGSDYTFKSGTLEIPAGEATATITVYVIDDDLHEPAETFRLVLTGASNATIGDGRALGTILNDESEPILTVEDVTVDEGDGTATFTVTLTPASGLLVGVDYATADVSATADLDYTPQSGSLVFAPETTTGQILVPILEDAEVESTETFTLTLNNARNAEISDTAGSATGSINDDDTAADLSMTNVKIREDRGPLEFTVTLTSAKQSAVTVDYRTAGVTATEDTDYTSTSGMLTIEANQTSATFSIPITDDELDEDPETFQVWLDNPSSNATAPDDPATVTIEDDDNSPSLSAEDVTVSETERTVTVTIDLAPASGRDVTVGYVTADGSAKAGADYSTTAGLVTIVAGETSADVRIPITHDVLDEDDEKFTFRLTGATHADITDNEAEVTITDDDELPVLSIEDARASESAGDLEFNVTLTPVSGRAVTVQYETSNGTATAGSDYTHTSTTVTIPAGAESVKATVPIRDDSSVEDDETFTVTLSDPENATLDASATTATGTITDNDTASTTTPGTNRPSTNRPSTNRPSTNRPSGGGGDRGGGPVVSTQTTAAPRIGVFLQDVVLVLNEPPMDVNLVASAVRAIDSYRALAADPRIVTVVVSGSKLTLNPVALGVTTVSVSATNSRGSAFQTFRVTVIERGAPRIVSFLPDRVLTVGDSPTAVNVAPAFGGTVNSYSATAGDPRLVGVVASGSNVSLTGLTPGVTTVSVIARNRNGVTLQTFRVTVRSRSVPGTTPLGPQQEIPTH